MSYLSPVIELRNRFFSYFKIEEKNFPDKKAYVRGLNVNSIRAKGLCRATDSLEKIVNLIFESDFSTTTAVTEISGRGMGMDAVRKCLSDEGGRIDLILDAKVPDAQGFIPFHFELYIPQHLWEKAA